MDQDISIDIFIPKLLEWLLSRRHCQHEWQKEVVKIRNKINVAIQDMPQNDKIANLLSGAFLNYFHCLKIVEILKETEADSKNIFGMYSSKRMKDWNDIVNNYTKNNVYLAEAADLLINIVKYELPNLKKQMTKQQQLQTEFNKKEADAIKSVASTRQELANFLKELGLKNQENTGSYKTELLKSAQDLPVSNQSVAGEVKNILLALAHYKSFAAYSQPNSKLDMALIEYIAEKGNTTTYEWVHGCKPTKVITPINACDDDPCETNDDEIDWGISYESNIEIEVVDSGSLESSSSVDDNKKQQVKFDPNEKLAEGVNALTLLDNFQTRTKFLNQLLELKAFLKGRLLEADIGIPFETISESKSNLEAMMSEVQKIIKLLTNPTIIHQYNITHSPRYLDDILKKIQQKEDAIERFSAIATVSRERSAEAAAEYIKIGKLCQSVVKKSKELENEIIADISHRYNGRNVHLMGGATVN